MLSLKLTYTPRHLKFSDQGRAAQQFHYYKLETNYKKIEENLYIYMRN